MPGEVLATKLPHLSFQEFNADVNTDVYCLLLIFLRNSQSLYTYIIYAEKMYKKFPCIKKIEKLIILIESGKIYLIIMIFSALKYQRAKKKYVLYYITRLCMVIIQEGSSDHVVHMWSEQDSLIWLRHLWTQVSNLKRLKKDLFFYTRAQHVLSNHLI